MRRPYRKHFIVIENQHIKVKDWMRKNSKYFTDINGVPTSEQIGKVLIGLDYERNENELVVLYEKQVLFNIY